MQKHITRYATEAAYDSDFDNLDFPNVSYIDEGDEVRYMEENPYLIWGTFSYLPRDGFAVYLNSTDTTTGSYPSGYSKSLKGVIDDETKTFKINIKQDIPLMGGSFLFFSGALSTSTNSGITKIYFPKSLNTSNITSMHRMFWYGTSLRELDLSDWDTSNVVYMSSIFQYCTSLTTVGDISRWVTTNVTTMSRMFDSSIGEMSITTLPDLSGWVTTNVTTMNSMFRYCGKLATIGGLLPIGDGTKDVNTDSMFYRCSKLTTINKAGAIHNTVSFYYCPLTLDSAKVILNALSTPYSGNQTLSFSATTNGYINADSEALAIVAEKQALGWTIAL